MPDMYKDIVGGVNETVEIDGYPFYAENISSNNSYNHRELNRQPLLGGTEKVTRGKYLVREYSFTTEVYTEGNPRIFDEIFQEMCNKECEVISEYMGGKFKAEVNINYEDEEASPEHRILNVEIKEIAEQQPNIPGEQFIIPEDVILEENASATNTENDSNITEITPLPPKKNVSNDNKTVVDDLKDKLKSRGE